MMEDAVKSRSLEEQDARVRSGGSDRGSTAASNK